VIPIMIFADTLSRGQVLGECERRGLRVWQQYGAAYIARPAWGRLLPAPSQWQRHISLPRSGFSTRVERDIIDEYLTWTVSI